MAVVVLIDDEEDLVESLRLRLESDGHTVHAFTNSLEGFNHIQRDKPDLVILDWMMPFLDGLSICKLLKFNRKFEDVPIILFSVRDVLNTERPMCEQVRADAMLNKPFETEELMNLVNDLLAKKSP